MKSCQCLSNNPCSGELRKWDWTEESVGWQRECFNDPSSQAWSRAVAQTWCIPAFLLGKMRAVQPPSQGDCEVKRDHAWEQSNSSSVYTNVFPFPFPSPSLTQSPSHNKVRQQKPTLVAQHLFSFHSLHLRFSLMWMSLLPNFMKPILAESRCPLD